LTGNRLLLRVQAGSIRRRTPLGRQDKNKSHQA
jgi:hypothetical protein